MKALESSCHRRCLKPTAGTLLAGMRPAGGKPDVTRQGCRVPRPAGSVFCRSGVLWLASGRVADRIAMEVIWARVHRIFPATFEAPEFCRSLSGSTEKDGRPLQYMKDRRSTEKEDRPQRYMEDRRSTEKDDRPLRYESSRIFLASSLLKNHSGHAVSRDAACRGPQGAAFAVPACSGWPQAGLLIVSRWKSFWRGSTGRSLRHTKAPEFCRSLCGSTGKDGRPLRNMKDRRPTEKEDRPQRYMEDRRSTEKDDRPLRYESSRIFLASSRLKTHSGHAVSRDEACRR